MARTPTTLTAFGKELRKLRIDLDITATKMAEESGIPGPILSQIEVGTRQVTQDLLDKLVNKYDYVADNFELFGRLAKETLKSVEIDLTREATFNLVAVDFAEKFPTLSEEALTQIAFILAKSKG
jgi:HTH-type transcriptional regulator, competence development regulator